MAGRGPRRSQHDYDRGWAALRLGLVPPTGLVTELPPFAHARLPRIDELVFGGHDVAGVPLRKRAEALVRTGALPPGLLDVVADALEEVEGRLRPGVDGGSHPLDEALAVVRADLETFRSTAGLERVVVVYCATTEAAAPPHACYRSLKALEAARRRGRAVLPASSIYGWAALEAGCPFVDFTPSTGVRLPALDELAQLRGVPHVGRDGKTGETLVKAALAAMFADRALRVCSWSGTNLLGGGDGAALARPGSATSKLRSKALGLEAILGYPVEGLLHIDHVEDLEEWKTAWDHVTFEGFLGTRMSLQFTWQGCDPALAAPLGALDALAFFFKDPVGTGEHRLDRQFARLCAWAARLEEGGPDARLPAPGTAR